MMTTRLGMVLGLASLLQACASDRPVGLPAFGDAVRANAAVQVVNPMAPMDRGPLVADGERTALQQERYVSDMVETPMDVGTLQGIGSGDGGGGGGSGGGGAGGVGAPLGGGATQ
jgi:hypothetical protein